MSAEILILLALHNAEPHLTAQLQSFCAQTHRNWQLLVSDDRSSDQSRGMIETFKAQTPEHIVRLQTGPHAGFAQNFLSLLSHSPSDTAFIALSDQDDIWLPDKLERALGQLAKCPASRPALYCSQSWIYDESKTTMTRSKNWSKPPAFANALVENIAQGNTIVLNNSALRLAQQAAPHATSIFAHDWWLYQLISGAGGQILYDPTPTLLYRQHKENALGYRRGALLAPLKRLMSGQYTARQQNMMAALKPCLSLLTAENRTHLEGLQAARTQPFTDRLRYLRHMPIYRQTLLGQIGLTLNIALGRQ